MDDLMFGAGCPEGGDPDPDGHGTAAGREVAGGPAACPGDSGPADSAGGESWLSAFAQSRGGDTAKPNAWQAVVVSDLSRADRGCDGATDDEALGLLRQWRALESWTTSGKLGVLRALIRRHPLPGHEGAPGDLPWEWERELEHEVSAALGMSLVGARKIMRFAWSLGARLPGVKRALDEGRLDYARAKIIVEETDVLLDPEKLAAAEAMILADLGRCRTWSDLLRLVQQAVITVDPEGAEKRRKLAEREQARVRFWRENSGTCGLQGTGLPTDEALRANAGIEARVQAYRKAGVKRYIDLLRVMALLDILNGVPVAGRVARCQAEDAEREAESAAESAQYEQNAKTRQGARDKVARMKAKRAARDEPRTVAGQIAAGQIAAGQIAASWTAASRIVKPRTVAFRTVAFRTAASWTVISPRTKTRARSVTTRCLRTLARTAQRATAHAVTWNRQSHHATTADAATAAARPDRRAALAGTRARTRAALAGTIVVAGRRAPAMRPALNAAGPAAWGCPFWGTSRCRWRRCRARRRGRGRHTVSGRWIPGSSATWPGLARATQAANSA